MLAVQEILTLMKGNPAPYDVLNNVYKDISKGARDINVILGIRGRAGFLPVCIRYFKKAISESNLKVNITVVEQDDRSYYSTLCKELNVDYVFIPNSIIKTGLSYNRSFCFNVGYLLAVPSMWYIFHDIDILVDSNFFNSISIYLDKNPKWLQTYTKRRVILLNESCTKEILSNNEIISLCDVKEFKKAAPDSTGGSILVRNDIFKEVGGFDPEFFYGYGPEDLFFWSKLEVCNKFLNEMKGPFNGGGTFADDPAIEIYHLYHEPMWNSNPDEKYMLYVLNFFWKYAYEDKLKLILEKKNILKNASILVTPA